MPKATANRLSFVAPHPFDYAQGRAAGGQDGEECGGDSQAFVIWVEQRFGAASKSDSDAASAAEVPQELKPRTRQQLYTGLEACSTLFEMSPLTRSKNLRSKSDVRLLPTQRLTGGRRI